MSRLAKAMGRVGDLLGDADPLIKSCQDAMYHHACHAKAARVAGDQKAERQHEFMFLRHALEHARKNKSRYGSMADKMRRNIDHYRSEADDEISYAGDAATDGNPKVKHHKEKKGFAGHKADKSFKEGYADDDGPDMKKSLDDGRADTSSALKKTQAWLAKNKR